MPPEKPFPRLHGALKRHGHHQCEDQITTNPIAGRIRDLLLCSAGYLYRIEEPHPNYSADFPNATNRLIRALPCLAPQSDCLNCGWSCKRLQEDF